ncbi:EcsC family protein [Anaeromyxobacter paludicola]|uniref:Peptidase n=1 Tax=Anaeromyxobacter paludicola TaxID=2918171 RepID=A0ABM7XEU5_9BACT|nr:EcsC family protein [Anaeromyxobacter paludicola]BDG10404.1 peptidase [Anaeromyxobacter paludicola]
MPSPPLTPADETELTAAKRILEHPGLAIRLADYLGRPVEALVKALPAASQQLISRGTGKALDASLALALRTLDAGPARAPNRWLHRGLAVASGALGGAIGLPGLMVELPVSTTLMFRAIADHARAQGEDLSRIEGRLECLTVFAYGTETAEDEASETAYFAVRAALAKAVSGAAEYVAQRGIAEAVGDRAAPALVQLLARVAQRFGLAVSEKAAAQLVPVLGAAGGAAVNSLFMEHYQGTARAHFTVRRLERRYGAGPVKSAYERLG